MPKYDLTLKEVCPEHGCTWKPGDSDPEEFDERCFFDDINRGAVDALDFINCPGCLKYDY